MIIVSLQNSLVDRLLLHLTPKPMEESSDQSLNLDDFIEVIADHTRTIASAGSNDELVVMLGGITFIVFTWFDSLDAYLGDLDSLGFFFVIGVNSDVLVYLVIN